MNPAFVTFIPLTHSSQPRYQKCKPRPHCTRSCAPKAQLSEPPDVGLTEKAGLTGTTCSNLFPIPILGDYGWFLNVYDRSLAAKTGPYVISYDQGSITLRFDPTISAASTKTSTTHTSYKGIATGNINVSKAVKKLTQSSQDANYEVRMFESGGNELFPSRRNEVHVLPTAEKTQGEISDPWLHSAPTYKVISRTSTYELYELYPSLSTPRNASKLEYFAMNLNPIPPFSKYSCFICVWRQEKGTCPVAIDKKQGQIRLSFFDALPVPEGVDVPDALARYAVKVFFGGITDEIVAKQYHVVSGAVRGAGSSVGEGFRIVVDNRPGVFGANRRNEIWVPVE